MWWGQQVVIAPSCCLCGSGYDDAWDAAAVVAVVLWMMIGVHQKRTTFPSVLDPSNALRYTAWHALVVVVIDDDCSAPVGTPCKQGCLGCHRYLVLPDEILLLLFVSAELIEFLDHLLDGFFWIFVIRQVERMHAILPVVLHAPRYHRVGKGLGHRHVCGGMIRSVTKEREQATKTMFWVCLYFLFAETH